MIRKTTHVCLGLLLLVLLLLTGWGIYYAQDKGFSRHWRTFVEEEFQRRGVHATIRRLNLDPIRGLIAKDVLVYEDEGHQNLLMDVDKVEVDVDYSELFSGKLSIRSVEVRDAKIAIPLSPEPGAGDILRVDRLNGRILTPPDQLRIVRAEALVSGVKLSAHGSLSRPQPENPSAAPSEAPPLDQTQLQLSRLRGRREQIRQVLAWIARLEFDPASPPHIDFAIQGELNRLADLHATGKLDCGPVRCHSYQANSLSAAFEIAGRSLNVDALELIDSHGKLHAEFQFPGLDRDIPFEISADNDLHGLLMALFDEPRLKEFVFFDPPKLEVSGVYHLEKPFNWNDLPFQAIGGLRSQGITSRGVVFGAMGFDFNFDGEKLFLRDVRLEHKSGVLSGSFLRDAEGVRYEVDLRLPPTVFSPFLGSEGAKQFLKRWKFTEDSAVLVHLVGNGPGLNPADWVTTGSVDLRNCELNDHPITQLQCDLRLKGAVHEFSNVTLRRPEGEIHGKHIRLDHGQQLCHLDSVSGKVFPVHAAGWFASRAAQQLVIYDFEKPPQIEIDGVIDTRLESAEKLQTSRSRYSLSFASEDKAHYPFLGKRLDLTKPHGTVQVDGNRVVLNDFSAGLLDGTVKARVDLSNINSQIDYAVDAQLFQVNFAELVALYDQPRDTGGRLSAGAKITGRGPGLDHLRVDGRAVIKDGDVFSIPSIGPLAKPISKVLPKLHAGIHNATEATFSFAIKDGIFSTPDFAASTSAYDLKGHGDIDLRSRKLDFTMSIDFRNLPLIASLMAFKGEGSLNDPVWRPCELVRIEGAPVRKITSTAVTTLRKVGEALALPLPPPPGQPAPAKPAMAPDATATQAEPPDSPASANGPQKSDASKKEAPPPGRTTLPPRLPK